MKTLDDVHDGAYEVLTEAGTRYEIDLDRSTLTRYPDTGSLRSDLVAELRRDLSKVTLLAVLGCTVGDAACFLINLNIEDVPFTLRSTTTVMSIRRTSGSSTTEEADESGDGRDGPQPRGIVEPERPGRNGDRS